MSLPVNPSRYPLAFLPTPLHPLPRLSETLTPRTPASSFNARSAGSPASRSNATTRPAWPAAATRRASWSCCWRTRWGRAVTPC